MPSSRARHERADRRPAGLKDSEPDVENDFGPHLFLNVDAYQGPRAWTRSSSLRPAPVLIGMDADHAPVRHPGRVAGRSV